jgi:hypothetical protein
MPRRASGSPRWWQDCSPSNFRASQSWFCELHKLASSFVGLRPTDSVRIPKRPRADHSPRFTFILFVFKYITNFENLLFDNRMVLLNRERELSHRELPDGKLPAPAIIVSFGVAAHWWP